MKKPALRVPDHDGSQWNTMSGFSYTLSIADKTVAWGCNSVGAEATLRHEVKCKTGLLAEKFAMDSLEVLLLSSMNGSTSGR
ncbi:hypothetical protein [Microbulbifer hainanensis]|uniref:hypothetical protein n=1 Tax=Microbulbifer hainanensis TaxID=2735675 RepID=UPI001866B86F|nr:hypothetical protein [Microbulbifer hainanensis]